MTPLKGNRTAKVRKIFGDDYYDFRITYDGLVELSDHTDKGPNYILNQLRAIEMVNAQIQIVGDLRPEWIYEIIRIGLIGGGLSPREAVKLCDRYVREGWINDWLELAVAILFVATHGPEEEPVGGEPGEPTPEGMMSPTPSEESSGASSTNPLAPLA